MTHQRFELHRDIDHTGISGEGVVAEGVRFSDGTAVIRWRGVHASTVEWSDVSHMEAVHGHGGATRVVWLDEPDGLIGYVERARQEQMALTAERCPECVEGVVVQHGIPGSPTERYECSVGCGWTA